MIQHSLQLNFAKVKALDPRITFTRATTATYFNAAGVMQTAASGAARFDHNPATGDSLGLLIEEQRTNLLTYSQEFDNAAWTKTRSTISANAVSAPDGTTTADKLVEDATASNDHQITATYAATTGTTYTFSCYVRSGERTQIALTFGGSGAFSENKQIIANLSTGAVVSTSGTLVGSGVEDAGGGVYRVWLSATTTATATLTVAMLIVVGGSTTYSGDGTSGLYIWGAQLEAGAFPTSYIPTTSSAVTRNADLARMTGTNFSGWYNQTEGTFVVTFDSDAAQLTGVYRGYVSVNDGTANNNIGIYQSQTAGTTADIFVSGSQMGAFSATPYTNGDRRTGALAYKLNDSALSVGGGTVSSDSAVTMPTVTQMQIGLHRTANGIGTGHISRLTYFPRRLSNTILQELSA